MPVLDIEKFNPTRAEITTMVEKYKNFTIAGVEDVTGYLMVNEARKKLKRARVQIEKDGKMLRSEAVAFQKAVIEKEKELVSMIEPTENDLAEKQAAIDLEKEKIKRLSSLPDRVAKLSNIGVTMQDDMLLIMDDQQFLEFFNYKNLAYLKEKEEEMNRIIQENERKARELQEANELKLKEQQDKIDKEKKQIEDEKLAIEREKQKQIEDEKARVAAIEATRREMDMEVKRKEEQRIAELEAQSEKERIEQEKLEARKKYQTFLASNGWKEGGEGFYIEKTPTKIILYKFVAEFKL